MRKANQFFLPIFKRCVESLEGRGYNALIERSKNRLCLIFDIGGKSKEISIALYLDGGDIKNDLGEKILIYFPTQQQSGWHAIESTVENMLEEMVERMVFRAFLDYHSEKPDVEIA